MSTVGLIANPLAGKDVRRFVSAASINSDRNKIEILKRCVLGAVDAGAENILLAHDFRNLSLRAVESLNLGNKIIEMPIETEGNRQDTTRAAEIFKKEKVKAIISLGGDGTQRDLISGWMDAPLLPISTGTNNVFPFMVDPTVAGTAAGDQETLAHARGQSGDSSAGRTTCRCPAGLPSSTRGACRWRISRPAACISARGWR